MNVLKKDRDGKYSYHGMAHDQCQIIFDNMSSIGVYQVYRPDGLYAKVVGTFSTEQAVEAYCAAKGWEIRR